MNTVIEQLETFRPALINRATLLTRGDLATAEDLVQDTFVRAIRSIDTYKEDGKLRNWLFTILRNTYINHYTVEVRQGIAYSIEDDRELVESNKGAHHHDSFKNDALEIAFNKVQEAFRPALWLVVAQGYTASETSQILGVPLGTVLSRVSRGKKELAEAYKGGEA
jgi:RNA polymerase sigma-70 factor (ECF subfamily)